MKNYVSLLAFVAGVFAFASCSESETSVVIDNTPQKMTIGLYSSPSSSETRAVIKDGGLEPGNESAAVLWESSDKIFVWGQGNTTTNTFDFKQFGNAHNYAYFEGSVVKSSLYYILYPNQAGASYDGDHFIYATVPTYQKATLNSFDANADICAGTTVGEVNGSGEIAQVCAFLKITTTAPCYSVQVKTANNPSYAMVGGVEIDVSSNPKITSNINPKVTTVTLNASGTSDCSTPFPAGTYLIAIIPSHEYPGLDITVDYGNGNIKQHTNPATMALLARYIYNLGVAE